MPTLTIDGHEIEVPQGTKVIEAAELLGIIIPRFCYHPALGSVGACRVCAVMFGEGPVKGVQMSCMVEARDGMVVSTTHEEAVDFRKQVIEWLMLHHPHDCPVCDEGGHCLLQDLTVSGGHGIRRYEGKKWTYRDQYLGPFIQHEMNRCIHCYRCWRFYQEFSGYRDLGAMQISSRTCFGRFKAGPLESPFSGNLIDLCPTGVYTDKTARFKGRRWDFERGPSLCIHCSLGCHTVGNARYREMIRQETRFSEAVNGYFICDRGRFGFSYTNHPHRPRRARIGKDEVIWGDAVHLAAETLTRIIKSNGPSAVACLSSARSCLENLGMLKRLCRLQGWEEPKYFETLSTERKIKKAMSRLDSRITVSLREIEQADVILALGADPLNEAPMVALAMRQAFRKGAIIVVMDPRPISLPFEFVHLPVAPGEVDLSISVMVKRTIDRSVAAHLGSEALHFYDALPSEYPFEGQIKDSLERIESILQQRKRPVIVCGTDIVREATPLLSADSALLLQACKERAGIFYLMPGANAFGAALLSSAQGSLEQIIEDIERKGVKALLIVESDPFWLFPDEKRLVETFDRLNLLLVMDYLPSKTARYAHIFFPTSTLFESRASFINQEGRLQCAAPVHAGGIPIEQIGAGDHPPRLFRDDIPGGEPKEAWRILSELAQALSPQNKEIYSDILPQKSREDLWEWMVTENPVLADIQPFQEHAEGVRLPLGGEKGTPFSLDAVPGEKEYCPDNYRELLLVEWTFGTEELSGYSRHLQQVEKAPCLFMHGEDAAKLGLNQHDMVILPLEGGALEVELCVKENMAHGVLILPRHHQLSWQKMKKLPVMVPIEQIKKFQGD